MKSYLNALEVFQYCWNCWTFAFFRLTFGHYSAAIQCLKRKKLYEQQVEQLGNFQLRIHDQVIFRDIVKINLVLKIMHVKNLKLGSCLNLQSDDYARRCKSHHRDRWCFENWCCSNEGHAEGNVSCAISPLLMFH